MKRNIEQVKYYFKKVFESEGIVFEEYEIEIHNDSTPVMGGAKSYDEDISIYLISYPLKEYNISSYVVEILKTIGKLNEKFSKHKEIMTIDYINSHHSIEVILRKTSIDSFIRKIKLNEIL